MALLVTVIVRSEFDESTYDFKLPDVTTVADGSRLQDMILDLRCVLSALTDASHLDSDVYIVNLVEYARPHAV
jgi:hypothetical protein